MAAHPAVCPAGTQPTCKLCQLIICVLRQALSQQWDAVLNVHHKAADGVANLASHSRRSTTHSNTEVGNERVQYDKAAL
jgi:hypothetical protein